MVTFKGHRIQKSLIRAKFSPAATTGQRYIYTGCSTGRLISKYNYFVSLTVLMIFVIVCEFFHFSL